MSEAASARGGLTWSVRARDIEIGGVRIDFLEAQAASDAAPEARLLGIELPRLGAWGQLAIRCEPGAVPCVTGSVDRRTAGSSEAVASAGFDRRADRVRVSSEGGTVSLHWGASIAMDANRWPLAPWLTGTALPVDLQGGRLSASFAEDAEGLRFEVDLESIDFDTPDGRFAGAGIDLSLRGAWDAGSLQGQGSWRNGEALLDALYLPPPPAAILADYSVSFDGPDPRARVRVESGEWLDATLTAALDEAAPVSPEGILEARIDIESLDLATAWPLGPESLAAGAGWPDLDVQGGLTGSAAWTVDDATVIDLAWRDVDLEDPAGRVRIRGLDGELLVAAEREHLRAAFDSATVYRLPLDASRVALAGRRGRVELEEPLRVPLLDGAIRLDRLVIDRGGGGPPTIDLDAVIEPLDLARLTGTLGLPRFGGSLSGQIPAVRLDGDTLRVGGGLDLELFSGRARITGLSIERPFGTLPALSGSLDFERLDLAPLTTAFEFGAMQGELSGYVRDLRLLDWQPVAFDAWLATERETDKRRRISQRAVDQIARLGGGSAAALSAPILRLFDDFAYSRIGLGCRLAANVCNMRGVRERDGGGYVIVDGRGIPRLDVIGYRREVDWPVFVAQLRAATQGDGVRVGD